MITDKLLKIENDLQELANYIRILEKHPNRPPSTLQPMSIMRDNIQEAKNAQENPSITYIQDRTSQIFKDL